MRVLAMLLIIALAGCEGANPNSLVGVMSVDARKRMDDEKCREFGFQKGTEAYGKCRLELERQRSIAQTGSNTRINVQ